MQKKQPVQTFECRGGFALIGREEIERVIAAYRDGQAKKRELRVFAAHAEKKALPEKSRVDLARVLNCKAQEKGIKRLGRGEVARAGENLAPIIKAQEEAAGRLKPVARRALRAIAQGKLTSVESIVLLYYFARRITQVKALKRLLPLERYARFTYGELSDLSGIARANLSRAVLSLKRKGLLSTVWVVKPNENQFGLLFVDGPALTLIPGAAADRSKPERSHKKPTPPAQITNTPVLELPTLKKIDPKRDTKEIKSFVFKEEGRKFSSDFERIREKARQMKEFFQEQAA